MSSIEPLLYDVHRIYSINNGICVLLDTSSENHNMKVITHGFQKLLKIRAFNKPEFFDLKAIEDR